LSENKKKLRFNQIKLVVSLQIAILKTAKILLNLELMLTGIEKVTAAATRRTTTTRETKTTQTVRFCFNSQIILHDFQSGGADCL
jgi:hypothetical protein